MLIAAIAALAVIFGGEMASTGSGAVQQALRTMGFGRQTAIEAVQREQGAAISDLDDVVRALNAAVAGLSARVDFDGNRDEIANQHFLRIHDDFGVLRAGMNELRAAQSAAAAQEPWRRPIYQLTAAVTKSQGELADLRASVHEFNQPRDPNLVAIGTRIDRLEQAMVQHNLLESIRGSMEDTAAEHRPPGLRERSSPEAKDGHVIDLTPAQPR